MEFKEVNELVPGTKYRIVGRLKFTAVYSHIKNTVHIFKNVQGYGYSDENPFVHYDDKPFAYYDEKPFAYYINKFYKPILRRDRNQQEMEERSLQLILKNIIGDHSFSW